MPAISLASAADLNHADDLPVGRYAHVRKPSPMALVPEAARIAIAQGCDDVMSLVRQTWFYRQTLSGPVPVRIHAYTDDHRTRVLQDADALMRGRFRLGGQAVDIRQGSIFDQPAPSAEFAAALHGFDWLRHLEAAGGDLAREFALKLTQHWLNRNARYTIPAWRPDVTAERFINLFCHGRFFLGDLDEAWRAKFFTSLRDQALVLARSLHRAPDGLPRLKCAAALALAGFCLGDDRFAAVGIKRFSAEIDRQILSDGGHISRSPGQLLDVARLLTMLKQALALTGREPDAGARSDAGSDTPAAQILPPGRWSARGVRRRGRGGCAHHRGPHRAGSAPGSASDASPRHRVITGSRSDARSFCSMPARRCKGRSRPALMRGA